MRASLRVIAEALRRGGVGLAEFPEQLRLLLRGRPDTAVGHGHLDPVAPVDQPSRLELDLALLVNLQALLNRLNRICRRRMGSTVSEPRSSGASAVRRFVFWSAS